MLLFRASFRPDPSYVVTNKRIIHTKGLPVVKLIFIILDSAFFGPIYLSSSRWIKMLLAFSIGVAKYPSVRVRLFTRFTILVFRELFSIYIYIFFPFFRAGCFDKIDIITKKKKDL